MAIITTYPVDPSPATGDYLVGSKITNTGAQINPTKNFTIGSVVEAGLGYKVYSVLLNQTGANPPVPTELKNDYPSITFTWTRFLDGQYRLEASSPIFIANKTAAVFNLGGVKGSSTWNRLSDTFFEIETGTTGSNLDGFLSNGYLEIRIYS